MKPLPQTVKTSDADKARIVIRADVSFSTVTRAYRGKSVLPVVRIAIEKAARELGVPLPPPPQG